MWPHGTSGGLKGPHGASWGLMGPHGSSRAFRRPRGLQRASGGLKKHSRASGSLLGPQEALEGPRGSYQKAQKAWKSLRGLQRGLARLQKTDRQKDVWKLPSLLYRISDPPGPLPCVNLSMEKRRPRPLMVSNTLFSAVHISGSLNV